MDNRKFGIELEVINITPEQAIDVFDQIHFVYSTNTLYRHRDYNIWKATTDSSINASRSCEIVSPILQGQEGLDQIKVLTKALTAAGASVNRSCGFHVHLDAHDLSAKNLRTIIQRYAKHENEIDLFMPKSRRNDSNNYCHTLNDPYYMENNPLYWFSENADNLATALSSKYLKVNPQCYIRQRTVEFRQHSGTLDYNKIQNWVKFVMQFTKNCKDNYEDEYLDNPRLLNKYVRGSLGHRFYNVPMENIVNKLCNNVNEYVSYEDLKAAANSNVWYAIQNLNIQKYIKELRRQLQNIRSPSEIKNKRNFGYMLSMPQFLRYKNEEVFVYNDTIWDGIDNDVKSFFEQRKLQLSSPKQQQARIANQRVHTITISDHSFPVTYVTNNDVPFNL